MQVSSKEVFDNNGDTCLIVMELMTGGEMFDRIVSKEIYSELEAKDAIKQIVEAIDYCHDQNVVHR
jgi:calcium/calmodulin-dependent protein kinase I